MSIATNLQRLVDAKSDIADAITAKGGTVNQGDGFEDFATDIDNIPTGGGVVTVKPLIGRAQCRSTVIKKTISSEPCYQLQNKTWYGTPAESYPYINGSKIWSDGDDIYYTDGYKLNKETSTWESHTITFPSTNARSYFISHPESIWTDGTNVYFSYYYNSSNNFQLVFDKSTSTWSNKTWSGLTNWNGAYVWSDGENIYYSYNTTHKILNIATSTWSTKTWQGLSSFSGTGIWTDGHRIYYATSSGSDLYILNNDTWSRKTFVLHKSDGTTDTLSQYGAYKIFSNGVDVYWSYQSAQYIYDRHTDSWREIYWKNPSGSTTTDIFANGIWRDGSHLYFSYDHYQYELPCWN